MVIIIKSHLLESKDKQKHKTDIRDGEKIVEFRKLYSGTLFFLRIWEDTAITQFLWRNTVARTLELRQSSYEPLLSQELRTYASKQFIRNGTEVGLLVWLHTCLRKW
jgi:hypothetical protein